MVYEVTTLRDALADIESIVCYLTYDLASPAAARDFLACYEERVGVLCTFPAFHPLSSDPGLANLGYRAFPVGRYVVLYKFDGHEVMVARVFHQSQDYARILLKR